MVLIHEALLCSGVGVISSPGILARIDPRDWSSRPPTQRARKRLTKYARREL
jgi:hypothetical protein